MPPLQRILPGRRRQIGCHAFSGHGCVRWHQAGLRNRMERRRRAGAINMPSCLLREYQTLIVGAVGFAGVIATLFTNAWLSRKEHTRQVDHERTALKAALSAELSIIRDAYRDRIEMIGNPPETPWAAQSGPNAPSPSDTISIPRVQKNVTQSAILNKYPCGGRFEDRRGRRALRPM
jgi:hypothetical protein